MRGSQGTSLALIAAPAIALLLFVFGFGGTCLYFNSVIRLPMVAGWDHLLPAWFSRLHPRFKTPVGSIICVAAATFIVTFVGNFGVGAQEAFQFLNNSGLICWALTYLVMFAIPLVGRGEHPPQKNQDTTTTGFVLTLAYAILAIFPVVEVKNPLSFTLRAVCLIVGLNAAGAWYFKSASRRRHAPAGELY